MKTYKHILMLPVMAILFAGCENFFDEKQLDNVNYRPSDVRTSMTYTMTEADVALVGKQCTYKGNDTVPSVYEQKALSLCVDGDSTAYIEWKKIASLKAFTEDASPDIYVPMFMAQKFPYLDAGTICNVTYPLYEGKSLRQQPFQTASSYALVEDDYRAVWNGRGASYLTATSEQSLPEFLKNKFPTATEGKVMVLTYDYLQTEPDTIYPALPYECTVHQLLEAEETVEHQLTGIIGTVKSAIYGRFYLRDLPGDGTTDSIYVYGLTDEDGGKVWSAKGLKAGDKITIKGKYSNESSEPQIVTAIYVSHESGGSGMPRRRAEALTPDTVVKQVAYILKGGEWNVFADEQLTALDYLPQSVYDRLGVTAISNPDEVIGKYLRQTYPYALEKQIYMVVYMSSTGMTADEWVFNGTEFVMNTGFVEDVMSFVRSNAWVANISTYYTTPFVGEGPADFTIHHVALDGLNYVWRYQASYGMTASAYVSGTNHPVEDWLVSPKIRLKKSEKPVLTFDMAVRYGNLDYNKEWLKVMVTDNFTGDVTATQWEHLEFPDSIPDGSNWVFLNSGNFDLSKYNGQTINIAFQYNTTTGELTSAPTWEIQNVLVHELEEENAEE